MSVTNFKLFFWAQCTEKMLQNNKASANYKNFEVRNPSTFVEYETVRPAARLTNTSPLNEKFRLFQSSKNETMFQDRSMICTKAMILKHDMFFMKNLLRQKRRGIHVHADKNISNILVAIANIGFLLGSAQNAEFSLSKVKNGKLKPRGPNERQHESKC